MKKLIGILGIVALTSVSLSTFAYEHSNGEKDHGEFREEMKEAVEADDYSLLSDEAQAKINEEEFAKHVEKYAEREAYHEAIKEAVVNNDFDTFAALHEDMKDTHAMHHGDEDTEAMHEEKKLAMMQEHFDILVAYYNEHGELPSIEKMKEYFAQKKSDHAAKHMKKKIRKHFKDNHKQFIRKAIHNADEATLEILLERIEDRIENVEGNESMDAERKEVLLDMLGGIYDTVEELLAEITA